MFLKKESCKLRNLDTDVILAGSCIGCGFKLFCDIRF